MTSIHFSWSFDAKNAGLRLIAKPEGNSRTLECRAPLYAPFVLRKLCLAREEPNLQAASRVSTPTQTPPPTPACIIVRKTFIQVWAEKRRALSKETDKGPQTSPDNEYLIALELELAVSQSGRRLPLRTAKLQQSAEQETTEGRRGNRRRWGAIRGEND